jgi:cellobiose-specific phosphotransferase system component IIA
VYKKNIFTAHTIRHANAEKPSIIAWDTRSRNATTTLHRPAMQEAAYSGDAGCAILLIHANDTLEISSKVEYIPL